MKAIFALLALVAIASADNWAVLVSGSRGYSNYRHHADVAHAYQIMKRGGLNPDHVVTMLFGDVASSTMNPFPGELYNRPGDDSPEVLEGVEVDYEGKEVSAENFLKLLKGDESAGGKVLKTTNEDNIFIFYSDHGSRDLLCFPEGDLLHSKELLETLDYMYQNKLYKKMVIYVEACYAGSMFLELPKDRNIVAVTAANEKESSYGWYCGEEAVVKGKKVGSCLGDEFSISWMEDADKGMQETETLEDQFNYLVKQVSMSHVMRYGDVSFAHDVLAEYIGPGGPGPKARESTSVAWDSRDNDLLFYKYMYEEYKTAEFEKLYKDELSVRQQVDRYFNSLRQEPRYFMYSGKPVRNLDCYKRAIQQFRALFGNNEYGLKYFDVYANMCEENDRAF